MEYTTTEGEGVVSVCAAITHPETGVPRPFNLSYTRNGSAGTWFSNVDLIAGPSIHTQMPLGTTMLLEVIYWFSVLVTSVLVAISLSMMTICVRMIPMRSSTFIWQ